MYRRSAVSAKFSVSRVSPGLCCESPRRGRGAAGDGPVAMRRELDHEQGGIRSPPRTAMKASVDPRANPAAMSRTADGMSRTASTLMNVKFSSSAPVSLSLGPTPLPPPKVLKRPDFGQPPPTAAASTKEHTEQHLRSRLESVSSLPLLHGTSHGARWARGARQVDATREVIKLRVRAAPWWEMPDAALQAADRFDKQHRISCTKGDAWLCRGYAKRPPAASRPSPSRLISCRPALPRLVPPRHAHSPTADLCRSTPVRSPRHAQARLPADGRDGGAPL